MRFSTVKGSALPALAVALMAIATPAIAQEWRVTPAPLEVQGITTCSMGLMDHPEYSLAITLNGDKPNLLIRSPLLMGVHGSTDIVLGFPDGFQSRVPLIKDSTDSDTAMVEIQSDANLYDMIDGFAVPGDFSVVVLGGRPTAFRLPEVPAAKHAIPTMKDCVEEFYYG